jgi:hypothetical protein
MAGATISSRDKALCLSVLNHLESRPISELFRQPIVCRDASSQGRETSLATIRTRVLSGEIDNFSSFSDAMDLWFSLNALKKNQFRDIAITELRKIYNKKIALCSTDRQEWLRQCSIVSGKLDKLLKSAPPVAQFPIDTRVVRPHEIKFLTTTIQLVTAPLDLFHVTRILARDPDRFDFTQSQIHVDLKHLRPVVLYELVDYLKTRFPDQFRQAMHPGTAPAPVTRFDMWDTF